MYKDFDMNVRIDVNGVVIGYVPLATAYEAHRIALEYVGQAITEANLHRARREISELVKEYQLFKDHLMNPERMKPKRVVFSGPKTIVFWPDGSKTMVSLGEGQEHDEYAAFCAAVVKKMFSGSTPKAKKFMESIKVVQKLKAKKAEQEEIDTTVGNIELRVDQPTAANDNAIDIEIETKLKERGD